MSLAHELLDNTGELAEPVRFGHWLCTCEGCAFALARTIRMTGEDIGLVIKRAAGRNIVSGRDYLADYQGTVNGSLEGPDDYVREVFVADRHCAQCRPGMFDHDWFDEESRNEVSR